MRSLSYRNEFTDLLCKSMGEEGLLRMTQEFIIGCTRKKITQIYKKILNVQLQESIFYSDIFENNIVNSELFQVPSQRNIQLTFRFLWLISSKRVVLPKERKGDGNHGLFNWNLLSQRFMCILISDTEPISTYRNIIQAARVILQKYEVRNILLQI